MPYFFWLPSLIGLTGLLTTLGVALHYSKYMLPVERTAVVSFLTLPLIGIVIKLFYPETPFVTLAIVISVIILFISYETRASIPISISSWSQHTENMLWML